jgi:hypothetical protein
MVHPLPLSRLSNPDHGNRRQSPIQIHSNRAIRWLTFDHNILLPGGAMGRDVRPKLWCIALGRTRVAGYVLPGIRLTTGANSSYGAPGLPVVASKSSPRGVPRYSRTTFRSWGPGEWRRILLLQKDTLLAIKPSCFVSASIPLRDRRLTLGCTLCKPVWGVNHRPDAQGRGS